MSKSYPKHIIVIRWFSRVASIPLLIVTLLLFFQDGLPFYLFKSDPFHMTALSISLVGLLLGWKWDGPAGIAILIGFIADWIFVCVKYGQIMFNMGPIFSFLPVFALLYLYCFWKSKKAKSDKGSTEIP